MDSCAGKLIRTNHRLMGTYVQLMPQMVQRRMEEMESKAAENAKAAEAAATSGTVGTATSEAAPSSMDSPLPTEMTSSVTGVAPEVHDTALKPTGLEIPTNAVAAGVGLSSSTPFTHRTNISEFKETELGFPQPVVSGIQKDSENPKSMS